MVASHGSDGTKKLVVTYREAADALGLCERKVWQLVKDGELNAVRVGRSVRIPVTDLERFVADNTASD